jgi:hypothetical protein
VSVIALAGLLCTVGCYRIGKMLTLTLNVGRVMSQAVGRRPLTQEARVQLRLVCVGFVMRRVTLGHFFPSITTTAPLIHELTYSFFRFLIHSPSVLHKLST